jgi:hypothetical protein
MIINDKRALAYVAEIAEIQPIPNYDRVEHARINGWWVIVSKADNFIPGTKCIYFEVDSHVPEDDERFAFLEKRHYNVKTLKMCKVFSQGLIMPMSAFPEVPADAEINTDVTDLLHITYAVAEDNQRKSGKVDPNAKYMSMKARHKNFFQNKYVKKMWKYPWFRKVCFFFLGKKKDNPKSFPTNFQYVHKTDEERVENMPWVLKDKSPLIVTEKLDGTSCTYILERLKRGKFEFYVSSRNVRQLRPEQVCYHDSNIYWELAQKYDIENKMKQYLIDHPDLDYICIQGEGVGSVQGNPLKLRDNKLFVFNLITSDEGRWNSLDGRAVVQDNWGIPWVPILDDSYVLPDDMEDFKVYATAKSVVNPDVMREGVVLRNPETGLSFKNVSREYLMKHNG